MFEIDSLEECMVELLPFGSFPAWNPKAIQKAELPDHECESEPLFQPAYNVK